MRQFGSMVAALAPRRRWTRGRPRRCPQGSSPPGLVPRTSGPLAEDYTVWQPASSPCALEVPRFRSPSEVGIGTKHPSRHSTCDGYSRPPLWGGRTT